MVKLSASQKSSDDDFCGGGLDDPPDLSGLNLVNPPRDDDVWVDELGLLQVLDILLNVALKVGVSQELATKLDVQFLNRLRTQVLLHQTSRSLSIEQEHAAAGVLDYDDLLCPEKLLGDDDGAQRVFDAAASIADDMGGAERNAEGGGWVDTSVHACLELAPITTWAGGGVKALETSFKVLAHGLS